MKLAVLMQCHKNPEQINRFLEVMRHEKVTFFLHVDRKSDIAEAIRKREDIILLPDELRVDVKWSRFSQVEATLNLMKYARLTEDYDFYWVVSGQDFPIKPVKKIVEWFEQNPDQDFLELFESKNYGAGKENNYDKRNRIWFPNWMLGDAMWKRISKRVWTEVTGGYHRTFFLFQRKNRTGMKFYFGSSWACLSRDTLKWCLDYVEGHQEYSAFFHNANCPDESFFQTLVMNSPYRSRRRDYLHYVDWGEGNARPKLLKLEDLGKLVTSEKLLARKFDEKEDAQILLELEKRCGIERKL